VLKASALLNEGIDRCWKLINERQEHIKKVGWLTKNRKDQQKRALTKLTEMIFYSAAMSRFGGGDLVGEIQRKLEEDTHNEYGASLELMQKIAD
jgi:putative protein kinase ArgK-like GTPase of G3E family